MILDQSVFSGLFFLIIDLVGGGAGMPLLGPEWGLQMVMPGRR